MSGHHLSAIGRGQLELLLRSDLSKAEIARQLGCHRSTVYRELARNSGPGGRYRWQCAQDRYRQRRTKCVRGSRMSHGPLREHVEDRVREKWSPEQIACHLVRSHPEDPAMRISHETIYKHVYLDKRRGGSLHTGLRQGRKRRQKRANTTGRRGIIPNRTPIHERPKVVETQSRVGDWEGDTIIGRNQQGAVATFVDRKSLYIVAAHMPNRTAEALNRAAAVAFKAIPASIRHTLTVDNGKEFSGFKAIEEALGLGVYFADPYASWQRAINENTNGLLRQYIPKKTDMRDVSPEDLKAYIHKLNNRPRKKLGYRTPAEVLQEIGVAFGP